MDDMTRQRLAEEIGIFLHDKRTADNATMLFIGFFDQRMSSLSAYQDDGDSLTYADCGTPEDDPFWMTLLDIWKAQPRKHQWQILEAILEGEEIKLFFFYPDKPRRRNEDFPPREPIIRKYFGDKPVVYPPHPRLGPEDLGFEL